MTLGGILIPMSARFGLFWVSLIVGLGGCASTSSITIYSNPEAASLSTDGGGQQLGRAPVVFIFDKRDLEAARSASGCFYLQGIEAVWESGAVKAAEAIEICDDEEQHYKVTLQRPTDVVGLQQDLDFARDLRAADIEEHRRDQRSRTQYFPLQTPTKPNGPAQPPSSNSR